VAERDHVAERADHAQPAIAGRRRGAERAASGVAVQEPLLDQDVERLADGGAAHAEPRAELVLRLDPLSLATQLVAKGLGDLQVPGHTWALIHDTASAIICLD